MGARGICGSGIIEAAAEMLKAGVILANGNFDPELSHERMVYEDGKPRKFVIARAEETAIGRPITVSLKDIRSLQLAKAALRAGEEILLRSYGVEKPDGVILAGAFGTYIDKHHALAIGMLPDCRAGHRDARWATPPATAPGSPCSAWRSAGRRPGWRRRWSSWNWPPTPTSRRST